MWPALFLSFCTSDPVPDEEFEGPTNDFPHLNTVPGRPAYPNEDIYERDHNRLRAGRDLALKKQAEAIVF